MGATAVALAVLVGLGDRAGPVGVRATGGRADDAVAVRADAGTTVIDVRSPFGISRAVLERTGERWPEAVVLRLHLKGLEHFRASNGTVTLEASASLREGKPLIRLWKDGNEGAPLGPESSYWMAVRVLGDGCFEMRLPRAFLVGRPKAVAVDWIDFYRN